MLVLGRLPGQGVVIDGPAIVFVTASRDGSPRLAVQAGDEVHIVRAELLGSEHPLHRVVSGIAQSLTRSAPRRRRRRRRKAAL
jgi:sRNA-binding carbon storage regulator CsrA